MGQVVVEARQFGLDDSTIRDLLDERLKTTGQNKRRS
jgi:hypothetical protein